MRQIAIGSVLFILCLTACSSDEGGESTDDTGLIEADADEAQDSDEAPNTGDPDAATDTDASSDVDSQDNDADDVDAGEVENNGQPDAFDCDNPGPNWLFCEDFTAGDGDFDTWFELSDFVTASGGDDRGRIDLSDEYSTHGDWSIHMPGAEESGYRGADLVWYACDAEQTTNCDLRGYDKLYFRSLIRFAEDHDYVHHFLRIRGLDRFWAYGSAGCLPNGESAMGTTVDFDEGTHETFFYTYHLDMGCDSNCGNYLDVEARCEDCANKGFPTCTEQEQCCWGDHFRPEQPVSLPVGEWFCFEMMMEANTPDESDGKMAYWVDDELGYEVDDMRWRTTDELQLNRAGLQHYVSAGSTDQPNRVWFDEVVVSTERIGCP